MRGWLSTLLERSYSLGRGAYLVIVVIAAVSVAALSFALVNQSNRLDDQQKELTAHLRLIETALIAECDTRAVVKALADQTVVLLKSFAPTLANERTIGVFEAYSRQLADTKACDALKSQVESTQSPSG